MRRFVWLGLGAMASIGCGRGEYPLETSFCDTWCDTLQKACADYEPAACVLQCEGGIHSCFSEQQAVVDCLKSTGDAGKVCRAGVDVYPTACAAPTNALEICLYGGAENYMRVECEGYCDSRTAISCPPAEPVACNADCLGRGLGAQACSFERSQASSCFTTYRVECDDSSADAPNATGGAANADESCVGEQNGLESCAAQAPD